MDSLFENIRTRKEQVEYCLRKFEYTRNSDTDLAQKVASEFRLDPLTIFETVRRIRQQFNEAGQFLPTSLEVAKQRRINEKVWRQALGYLI